MTSLAINAGNEDALRREDVLKGRLASLALITPYLLLTGIFFIAPLVVLAVRSFTLDSPTASGLTIDNYRVLVSDAVLQHLFIRTILIAVYTTAACLALGFPTAYLICRLSNRVGAVLLGCILLPFWVSVLVRLFALTTVLGRNGLINTLSASLGFSRFDLLFNTTATVIGMTNYLLPYTIVVLFSGISRVDGNLITAARSLGATPAQAFTRAFLPQVSPVLFSAATLVFVLSLGFFLTPAVLGGSQDTTVALYIQQQISIYRWGVASAIGVVLLAVSLIGYFVVLRIVGPGQLAGISTGGSKGIASSEGLPLSPTTVLLWVAMVGSLVLLLLPLIVTFILSFGESRVIRFPPHQLTLKWYYNIGQSDLWLHAIGKSLIVALLTAAVSTLIALALARAVTRVRSSQARSLIQTIIYAPLIVPVILLAIGMFDVETRIGLEGLTIGLVPLHAVIAVPLAFAALFAALSSIDPELETAARTLGSSSIRAFWTVTVPVLKGSLVGAFIISFVTSWDEAVIALFQSGTDKTLPVLIFSYIQSGVEPTVPAISTLLVLLVVLGFALRGFRPRPMGRKS